MLIRQSLCKAILFTLTMCSITMWVVARRPPVEKGRWLGVEGEEEEFSRPPLKLTFKGPAKNWTDAIPIGNGRLGAMVWGGVALETLQLNEDTLWTGTPGNYTNPNAPKALAEVRKLVDNRQFSQATSAAVKLSGEPSAAYQLLGDIKLEFDDSHLSYDKKTYHRELDLDAATTRVKYNVGGVQYVREHFASHPNNVLVTKISASKPGNVTFTVTLDSKMHHRSYVQGKNQIVMEGSCPSVRRVQDSAGGIKFAAILDLQINEGRGVVSVLHDGRLHVEGADWAVLRLVGSSSFDGPFTKPVDSKKDQKAECLHAMTEIRNLSYEDLYAHHLDDYQSLFHRVSLHLEKSSKIASGNDFLKTGDVVIANSKGTEADKRSTAERVVSFKTDEDPSLVELMFQYGRYLLISSSRPGSQVANLQGIWNKDIDPPWDGAQHLNINLQMNYWFALPCNLKECQKPLFKYISSLSKTGSRTAEVNYQAKGWVAHQVSDVWAKTSPDRGEAVWALWPMGGAWLCTHLWEHYTYTMDKEFLKNEAYPLLEGCTLFLLDWLIEGRDGYLETNPSTSPEHMFTAPDGKQASVSYSSTMDMSIIKEVFNAIVSAAEILGKEKDELIQRVRQAQPKLPPTKIAKDGSIMEWAEDFPDPDVHHRHVSHLFGVYPGHTITVDETPDLCKAANYTLQKRGEEGPGWSSMWKAALWARLRNSEHAYRMIKHLFDLVDPFHEANYEGGVYSNLFTAHPPFQIDANFGFSAAIAEMLVQGTVNDLYLLPALPRDKWANGCVKGLRARGGLTVSICWKEGDLHEVGLWSEEQNYLKRLHYQGTVSNVNIASGTVYTFNKNLRITNAYTL